LKKLDLRKDPNQVRQLTAGSEEKLTGSEPPFGRSPQPVGEFEKSAAGEELAGICWIYFDLNSWVRAYHLPLSGSSPMNALGLALAA
jgi:hypothetical protein